MENYFTIKADARERAAKSALKRYRKEGKIPAIIYGGKKESIPITVALIDIKTIIKSEKGVNSILKIHREDIQVDAMLKEVQFDYLSDNIIHADFIRIDLEEKINVSIPINLHGEPIGVRLEDGILDFITREVEIRCVPTKIPNSVEVDVEELHIGQSIRLEELSLDEEVQIISNLNSVICAVTSKIAEEVVEEEEEELEEGLEGDEEGDKEKPAEEEEKDKGKDES